MAGERSANLKMSSGVTGAKKKNAVVGIVQAIKALHEHEIHKLVID